MSWYVNHIQEQFGPRILSDSLTALWLVLSGLISSACCRCAVASCSSTTPRVLKGANNKSCLKTIMSKQIWSSKKHTRSPQSQQSPRKVEKPLHFAATIFWLQGGMLLGCRPQVLLLSVMLCEAQLRPMQTHPTKQNMKYSVLQGAPSALHIQDPILMASWLQTKQCQ